MKRFVKTFEIRWNDLDANRHVANTSFVALMTETRMAFLLANGFGQEELARYNIGPVIFTEEIHYLREVHPNEKVHVDMELAGLSEDGQFFRFSQRLYNSKGKMSAYFEVTGAWFDLGTRKLTPPPAELMDKIDHVPKSPDFRVLSSADTRKVDPVALNRELDLSQE